MQCNHMATTSVMPTAFVIPNQLASAIGTTDFTALGFNPMQKKKEWVSTQCKKRNGFQPKAINL